jgi:molybdopterin-guanine dinucleotide biosynthesis protein A
VRRAFAGGERRLKTLATHVVAVDDVDDEALINVNSEADLARLR